MGSDAQGPFNSAELREHRDRSRYAGDLRELMAANDDAGPVPPDAPGYNPVEAKLRRRA